MSSQEREGHWGCDLADMSGLTIELTGKTALLPVTWVTRRVIAQAVYRAPEPAIVCMTAVRLLGPFSLSSGSRAILFSFSTRQILQTRRAVGW